MTPELRGRGKVLHGQRSYPKWRASASVRDLVTGNKAETDVQHPSTTSPLTCMDANTGICTYVYINACQFKKIIIAFVKIKS